MTVLAVDTSQIEGSLAVGRRSGRLVTVAERSWAKRAMHSEVATLELSGLLADAGIGLGEITHILVNHGPGSFTGIRVGLNLARSLAFALDKPIAQIDGLRLRALDLWRPGKTVLVHAHALQNFHYAADFRFTDEGLVSLRAPTSIPADRLPERIRAADFVVEGVKTSARDLIGTLDRWPGLVEFKTWRDIHPLYIRGSEAEEKLKRGP